MKSSSGYAESPIAAALAEFVECFWMTWGDGGGPTPVLPDGCMDLVLERTSHDGEAPRRARLVGTMCRPRLVEHESAFELLAVRFRPGGAKALLNVDVAHLVDRRAPWAAVTKAPERLDASLNAPDVRTAMATLEAFLVEQRREVRGQNLDAARWASTCLSEPGSSVAQTAERLGVSRQHLRRRVVSVTGIGPKQLARIGRFRRVARRIAEGAAPSATMAIEAGYCDQAHMVNEFRALAGTTPGAYARFHSSKTHR